MNTVTETAAPRLRHARRDLLLHDTLSFLVLAAVAIALFLVTLGLFRSFMARRAELGRTWAARGQAALRAGHPEEAVTALRASLSYAPDDEHGQVLLAEALAAAGRSDEATSYFLNLWVAHPGDGILNLQLARLARRRGDASRAIDSYRAALFGVWPGDGVARRRAVRLELAGYMVERHDLTGARTELLIGAGNAADDPADDLFFGDRLLAVDDPADALRLYGKALAADPHNLPALERAGRVRYQTGDYEAARSLLARARRLQVDTHQPAPEGMAAMEHDAGRLIELDLSRELPARERAAHLQAAGTIAQQRLDRCVATFTPAPANSASGVDPAAGVPPALAGLRAQWKATREPAARRALATDAAAQDARMQLIFDTERDTERQTEHGCGAPAGDDALLLMLATRTSARQAQP